MNYLAIIKEIAFIIWQTLENWWWVPLPIILFLLLKYFYIWFLNNKYWARVKWITLEMKIPQDVDRPLKAMEAVIANFWTLYDPADFKEIWWEGKFQVPFFLEIAGIDGDVHFFLRMPSSMRNVFESGIYSQYPEVEIIEVEDYVKNVPQDIPNEQWDMWGCNFKSTRRGDPNSDCYPIKTYSSFFEPTQEIAEERRVDPLAVLIEGMSRLKQGEQLWFQMRLTPIPGRKWVGRCKTVVNELAQRPKEKQPKSITASAVDLLVHNEMPFQKVVEERQDTIPPEMRMTPGERSIVESIEEKMSKHGFETNMRMIYLGDKNVFFKPNLKLILNFSVAVSTENMNGLMPAQTTKVVPPTMFRQRKLYMKKKRMFRRYAKRWTPNYPWSGGTFVMNTEEVATLFHFPSKAGAPTPSFQRIESRKSGPPYSLPIEE